MVSQRFTCVSVKDVDLKDSEGHKSCPHRFCNHHKKNIEVGPTQWHKLICLYKSLWQSRKKTSTHCRSIYSRSTGLRPDYTRVRGGGRGSYKKMMCKILFSQRPSHGKLCKETTFISTITVFILDSWILVHLWWLVTVCASDWFKMSYCIVETQRPKRHRHPFKTSLRYYCTFSQSCRPGICSDCNDAAAELDQLSVVLRCVRFKISPSGQHNAHRRFQ